MVNRRAEKVELCVRRTGYGRLQVGFLFQSLQGRAEPIQEQEEIGKAPLCGVLVGVGIEDGIQTIAQARETVLGLRHIGNRGRRDVADWRGCLRAKLLNVVKLQIDGGQGVGKSVASSLASQFQRLAEGEGVQNEVKILYAFV